MQLHFDVFASKNWREFSIVGGNFISPCNSVTVIKPISWGTEAPSIFELALASCICTWNETNRDLKSASEFFASSF